MLTKIKHFGVRNNIERGRGSSLAETVSRLVAGIAARRICLNVKTSHPW